MTNIPKKETALMAEAVRGITRRQLITAVSIFAISLFITTLYLRQRIEWNQKIQESLDLVTLYKAKSLQIQRQDSVRNLVLKKNNFDPSNEAGGRIYGLFIDTEKTYSASDVAFKFNVTQPKAVKASEQGFIVPVKAIHVVRKNETASSIAKIYYQKSKDSVLIKSFNPNIKENKIIFIPFD